MNKNFFIARNYATAFLNTFLDDISKEDFLSIQNLLKFIAPKLQDSYGSKSISPHGFTPKSPK